MILYSAFGVLLLVIAALIPRLQKLFRIPSINYKESIVVFGASILAFYVLFFVSVQMFMFIHVPLGWSNFYPHVFALPAALILTYYIFHYILNRYTPVRAASSYKLYTALIIIMTAILAPLYVTHAYFIAAIKDYDNNFMITRYYADRHDDLAWLVISSADEDHLTEPVREYLPDSKDLAQTFMVRRLNTHEDTVVIVGGEADGIVIESVSPERLQNKIIFFTPHDNTALFLWGVMRRSLSSSGFARARPTSSWSPRVRSGSP
jgi:hypothetical protein